MVTRPRRTNLRPPGKCIFCDRGGDLSKEHMWADWLRNYIPRTMLEHVIDDVAIFSDKQEVTRKHRTGDPHSRRIRCVCEKCNNEWMGQLQEDAKPFLLPMLVGTQTSLRKKGQTTLAAWIAMMVMVAEYVDRDKIAIPSSDRQWMYTKHQPPSHWRIWIGEHARKSHPLFVHNVLSCATEKEFQRSESKTATVFNMQTSTICLGEHLLIHVMSSPAVRSILRRWRLLPDIEPAMCQIWPIRNTAVAWPLRLAVTDTGINALAEQFVNAANAILRQRMSDI
jgi:hypothetical protein